MYKRDEQIEEENLDWNKPQTTLLEKMQGHKKNVIFSLGSKGRKNVGQGVGVIDVQKKFIKLVEKNLEFASFIGVLILPYFVGFVLAYVLFYTYSGMTIIEFLMIDKEYLLLQLWSIGAYLFVTLWVIWAFSQVLQNGKTLLSLR